MNEEKYNLNTRTRRYFASKTLVHGFKRVFSSWKALIAFLFSTTAVAIVLDFWTCLMPDVTHSFISTCTAILFPILLVLIFYIFGYTKNSRTFYNNFVRIGFVNSAGEAPILLHSECDKNNSEMTVFTFYSKGLIADFWNRRIEEIQSAMNLTVASIKQGEDFRTVVVKAVPANSAFSNIIPWNENYIDYTNDAIYSLGKNIAGELVTINIDKMPHLIVAGSTGSGKTKLDMVIGIQALKRGATLYILDFKGLDFYPLEKRDAHILTSVESAFSTLNSIVDILYQRIDVFKKVNAVNYTDYIEKTHDDFMKRIFILIDECAMLTDAGTSKEAKKLSADCIDKLSTIARLGRALGIHLIISTQRPDANAVPGSIKSNIDCRICGKADTTLSTIILGDGRADTKIPKDSQGRFIMADGADDIIFQAFYFDD